MATIKIPAAYEPYEYQKAFFTAMESGFRKAILCMPRQTGKDTTCFAFMCQRAVQVPGNYFYIFPTKEMARRSLWEKVINDGPHQGKRLIENIPLDPKLGVLRRISNQEMTLTLTNNSTIRVLGLDKDPDAGRGISPTGVVLSEFAFSDPQVYASLIPALKRKDSWIVINSTPNGNNHFHTLFRAACQDKTWFVMSLQAVWPSLPNYVHVKERSELEQLVVEGSHTWEDIEREYGCSFGTRMKGTIYADFLQAAKKEGRIGDILADPYTPCVTFWDLGIDDSTAVWVMQKINNKFVFLNYIEGQDKDLTYFVEKLKDLNYKYKIHYLPHDANHRIQGQVISTIASELERTLKQHDVKGYYVTLPKSDVQRGIEETRNKLPRCYFNISGCIEGLKALELYHKKYDKKKKVYLAAPVHDWTSHAADALRMFGIHEDSREDPFFRLNNLQVNTSYDVFS